MTKKGITYLAQLIFILNEETNSGIVPISTSAGE
jgi:hypothetical protein